MTKQQKITSTILAVIVLAAIVLFAVGAFRHHAAPVNTGDSSATTGTMPDDTATDAGKPADTATTPPPADTARPNAFTNANYAFTLPNVWKAAVNPYVKTTTIFGPNATGTSGEGGVEIYPNQTSVADFMKAQAASTGITFTEVKDITTKNGYVGVSTYMLGQVPATNAYVTHLFKDGTVYTIYFRPTNLTDEMPLYQMLVDSFTVTGPVPAPEK